MRRLLTALPVLALAFAGSCDRRPETGDLFLVVVGSHSATPLSATASVDSLLFGPCDGSGVVEVLVGFRLNLLQPEPLPVPVDTYCDLGARFAADPFHGAIRLAFQTPDGSAYRVALDPGLATRAREATFDVDTKGILALDLDLLLDPDHFDLLQALPQPVDLPPSHPIAQDLSARVGDALVLLPSPEAAATTYVELWPRWDFSISARIDVEGCREGPLIVRHPDASSDGAPIGPAPIDPGGDDPSPRPPRPERSGCGACGGSGGSGGGDGCGGGGSAGCGSSGCSAGCNPDCSTVPLAPAAWAALVGLVMIRRRRGAAADPSDRPER
jgi:uncharacterized membrane protein YgcG